MSRLPAILAGVFLLALPVTLAGSGGKTPAGIPGRTGFPALLARLLEGDEDALRVRREARTGPSDPAFFPRLHGLTADASRGFELRVCAARLLKRAYGLAGWELRVDSTARGPVWERRDTLAFSRLKLPSPPSSIPRSAVVPTLVAALEGGAFSPDGMGRMDRISRRLAAERDTALTAYALGRLGDAGRRQAVYGVTLARMGRPEGRAWLLSAARERRLWWGGGLLAEVLKEAWGDGVLPALREGLRDGPPWGRVRSAGLLARLGDPSGADTLRSLLLNGGAAYADAVRTAADLGLRDLIPALRASASGQKGYGLFLASDALRRLGDAPGVRALVDTLLARPDGASRAAGVHLIGSLGRRGGMRHLPSEMDLRPYLSDPDTLVRFYAGEALREKGPHPPPSPSLSRWEREGAPRALSTDLGVGEVSRLTPSFHKGVSIDGWRAQRVTPEDLRELKGLGVDAVSYLPFGYQDADDRPALREGEFEQYGAALSACFHARRAGVRIVIKPHLWVRGRDTWHGRIAMKTGADWKAWFDGYRRFVLKFAAVAEAGGADLFCIGTELSGTSAREADWRGLIREVRGVYRGPLTYAANWDGEAERVAFWDDLDFIGIDAYYPLSEKASPSVEELVEGWGPVLGGIEALGRRHGRPVLFMEVGYPATEGAAQAPYREDGGRPTDPMGQAACYEALFRACMGKPWLAGMYLWRWNDPDWRSGPWDPSYNLRDKPAVAVLRRWYGEGG